MEKKSLEKKIIPFTNMECAQEEGTKFHMASVSQVDRSGRTISGVIFPKKAITRDKVLHRQRPRRVAVDLHDLDQASVSQVDRSGRTISGVMFPKKAITRDKVLHRQRPRRVAVDLHDHDQNSNNCDHQCEKHVNSQQDINAQDNKKPPKLENNHKDNMEEGHTQEDPFIVTGVLEEKIRGVMEDFRKQLDYYEDNLDLHFCNLKKPPTISIKDDYRPSESCPNLPSKGGFHKLTEYDSDDEDTVGNSDNNEFRGFKKSEVTESVQRHFLCRDSQVYIATETNFP